MTITVLLTALVTLAVAAAATGIVRGLAIRHGLLDVPNQRSSHAVATPRGGGVGIVLGLSVALVLCVLVGRIPLDVFTAITGGGLAVALVGLLDDRGTVSPLVRLLVHLASASWAVYWLGGMPDLMIGSHLVRWGPSGDVLAVLGVTWILNLFNFMDGIDGIAASEALFVAAAGVAMSLVGGGTGTIPLIGCAFAAACGGFLIWNWPPAKIFMGDVGSGYLGFVVGVLALAATRENPASFWVWLILVGVFLVDATVTLARRVLRGERVYHAHRSHAYQWLARRWSSHLRVTVAVWMVNLLWLLPCALLATLHPREALWIAAVALVLLAIAALALGSGRPEN